VRKGNRTRRWRRRARSKTNEIRARRESRKNG
jgi:hypothetical protein